MNRHRGGFTVHALCVVQGPWGIRAFFPPSVFVGSPGDDRQSVAVKDLLDAIYPRVDRPDYVVRLEPIQTSTKAVFQYLTTEEELARQPSHTPR